MSATPERREIDLHRRVCVIRPDSIDIRPARSAAVVPLLGFLLGIFFFVAVLFWLESVPFPLALLLMGAAIVLVPFSGMGFVYSVYGANVVINGNKRTALWQQGLFGMGVGTSELVPFDKIERLELEEISREEQVGGAQDFAQYEVRVLKISGKRLMLGQVTVPRYMEADGFARAKEAADAIAAMVEKPLVVVGEAGEQPPRRRRRRASTTA
jgi:hypothetical protein